MPSFLKTKSTLVFGEGDDVPAHHVHSSFLQGGTQIKFLWALINKRDNSAKDEVVLHNMDRNTTKRGFCKGNPPKKVQELGFPTS